MTTTPKFAYSVGECADDGPFGKTFIYEAIASGALVARKAGRRTIILKTDWENYLASLPAMPAKAAAAESTLEPAAEPAGA